MCISHASGEVVADYIFYSDDMRALRRCISAWILLCGCCHFSVLNHSGELWLLPALPEKYPECSVTVQPLGHVHRYNFSSNISPCPISVGMGQRGTGRVMHTEHLVLLLWSPLLSHSLERHPAARRASNNKLSHK